jgi:hypothetical protein
LHGLVVNTSYTRELRVTNSAVFFDYLRNNNSNDNSITNSLVSCSTLRFEGTNSQFALNGSLIVGDDHLLTKTTSGRGPGIVHIALVGSYGIFDADVNPTDTFIVGAGTSSARNNCFAAGNDGTDDYIKVGDTKLTEAKLQALLATLA